MTRCDATLELMLNWSLTNRLIEGFSIRETDVLVVLADGQTTLNFEEARAFMQSVVFGYARSSDSTIRWPAEVRNDVYVRRRAV